MIASLLKISTRAPAYFINQINPFSPNPTEIIYLVDGSNWITGRIAQALLKESQNEGLHFSTEKQPFFHCNKIIHFGYLNLFSKTPNIFCKGKNKLITTVYHGNYGLSESMDKGLDSYLKKEDQLSHTIVSTHLMKKRLIQWGVNPNKITRIPIGFEKAAFDNIPPNSGKAKRLELGIPADSTCIGSFQKDGNGWGEGLEPKLVKGPDIFVEAVRKLSQEKKVHILLTGPSRGYVKKKLEKYNIPYTHQFFENYSEVVELFSCLDLYLITSREEGGPLALMESMASGVPLVTTNVGMAPDMIIQNENGIMVDIEDVDHIVSSSLRILSDEKLRSKIISKGYQTCKEYDWKPIGAQHIELYKDINV